MTTHLRKSPPLPSFDYTGAYTYSLTFVTRRRAPIFADGSAVGLAETALFRACSRHRFFVHAYCFMPDHLHVLVSGSDDSSLTKLVHLFKQLSGFAVKRALGEPLWQISYYDHVLRRQEDIGRVADYIWGNPVGAGMADDAQEYAYSGPKHLMKG